MSGPIQNTHPTTPPPPRIEPSRGEPSRAQGAGQVQPQGGNVTIPSATPGYEQQYEVRQGDTLSAIARRPSRHRSRAPNPCRRQRHPHQHRTRTTSTRR